MTGLRSPGNLWARPGGVWVDERTTGFWRSIIFGLALITPGSSLKYFKRERERERGKEKKRGMLLKKKKKKEIPFVGFLKYFFCTNSWKFLVTFLPCYERLWQINNSYKFCTVNKIKLFLCYNYYMIYKVFSHPLHLSCPTSWWQLWRE